MYRLLKGMLILRLCWNKLSNLKFEVQKISGSIHKVTVAHYNQGHVYTKLHRWFGGRFENIYKMKHVGLGATKNLSDTQGRSQHFGERSSANHAGC